MWFRLVRWFFNGFVVECGHDDVRPERIENYDGSRGC